MAEEPNKISEVAQVTGAIAPDASADALLRRRVVFRARETVLVELAPEQTVVIDADPRSFEMTLQDGDILLRQADGSEIVLRASPEALDSAVVVIGGEPKRFSELLEFALQNLAPAAGPAPSTGGDTGGGPSSLGPPGNNEGTGGQDGDEDRNGSGPLSTDGTSGTGGTSIGSGGTGGGISPARRPSSSAGGCRWKARRRS